MFARRSQAFHIGLIIGPLDSLDYVRRLCASIMCVDYVRRLYDLLI